MKSRLESLRDRETTFLYWYNRIKGEEGSEDIGAFFKQQNTKEKINNIIN
jgi:hypothetical protein